MEDNCSNNKILYKNEFFFVQGAVFEVYREMGCGFLENVYHECLENELKIQNVDFKSQQELKLFYKGKPLRQVYVPDFICYDKIILELKAVKVLLPEHRAQVMNYLKATGFKLGLLINFGHHPKVEIQRIVL